MSAFRRRLMEMQGKERKPVAVRTVDGETIPVQTLYDYELDGQIQDEIYEEGGKIWLRKNIAEITLPEGQPNNSNINVVDLWDYLKEPSNNYSYDRKWDSPNAFLHIVPANGIKTSRINWSGNNFKPGTDIGVKVYSTIVRKQARDNAYTYEEINQIFLGAKVRIAINIEEQIKTYEVQEIIYR